MSRAKQYMFVGALILLAIFFLKKFGNSKYPVIDKAQIEIRQVLEENETSTSLKEKGIIVLDVGGGEFDHHKKLG